MLTLTRVHSYRGTVGVHVMYVHVHHLGTY